MIMRRDRFFGRKPQLQATFSALAAEKPQSVCILGERRIGRSSFLYHLKLAYQDYLPNQHRYKFEYLDLAQATCETRDGFRAELAKALFGETRHRLTPHQFDDLLADHNPNRDTKYVVLLDEFPVLQRRKEEFNDAFYDNLRSVANSGDLTWVLATHQSLDEIVEQNDFTSSFFGIFETVELKDFAVHEAQEAVLRPDASTGLDKADFDQIGTWLERAYHPFKLNRAAHLVWLNKQSDTQLGNDTLKANFDKEIERAFGKKISENREREKQLEAVKNVYEGTKEEVGFWTGGKPWLVGALILVLVLLALGFVTFPDLRTAFTNALGITTPVPTLPIVPPTPTP